MNLLAVKAHLMETKVASLSSLCLHFGVKDPGLLQDMLRLFVRRGSVRCFSKTPLCGKQCNRCDTSVTEIYEWVESDLSRKSSLRDHVS